MTIAQGTVLKAVATMDLPGGNIAQNVFYWRVVGVNPVDEAATLALIATTINSFYNAMSTYVRADVALDTVTVNEWDYNGTELWHTGTYIGEAALADTFAAAGEMFPHVVAAIIVGKTNDVNVVSRKSIAGFGEIAAGDSILVAGAVTQIVAAAAVWLATHVIVGSDALEPIVPALGGVIEPLVISLVGDLLGSQRRRKPGLGV